MAFHLWRLIYKISILWPSIFDLWLPSFDLSLISQFPLLPYDWPFPPPPISFQFKPLLWTLSQSGSSSYIKKFTNWFYLIRIFDMRELRRHSWPQCHLDQIEQHIYMNAWCPYLGLSWRVGLYCGTSSFAYDATL